MSSSDLSTSTWIQKTPNVIGGHACIRNTRIAVWMLVQARHLGMSDEEIRNRYDPPLSQADLDAAWDYNSATSRRSSERSTKTRKQAGQAHACNLTPVGGGGF